MEIFNLKCKEIEAALLDTIVQKNFVGKIIYFFSRKIVAHSIFWLSLLFLLTLFENTGQSFLFTLSNETINVTFYALIVYFNLYYLIPNFLTEKKLLLYSLLLVISVLLITPIKIALFYFKFSLYPIFQDQLINNQQWYFITMFLFVSASTIFKIISDWIVHQSEKTKLETQTMQSELKFLKSQINPHFLFNTLNNLYALTLKKSDQAPEIVIKLSEMMRYMLYDCNERRVPLRKEVNYVRNYLELEKLRQGKDVEINFNVEGAINDQMIAPLMFIPFLENSFKHGLNNEITHGYVNINIKVDHEDLNLVIGNSKPATLPLDSHIRRGGIGLTNVKRRLNLIYPNQHDLKIDDSPNSYEVTLDINLNSR